LAWENRISVREACDWVFEYKKFIFLKYYQYTGRKDNVQVCPSAPIDKVLALHIQHYDHFTSLKLARTFHDMYGGVQMDRFDQTINLYNRFFGTPNPKLWSECRPLAKLDIFRTFVVLPTQDLFNKVSLGSKGANNPAGTFESEDEVLVYFNNHLNVYVGDGDAKADAAGKITFKKDGLRKIDSVTDMGQIQVQEYSPQVRDRLQDMRQSDRKISGINNLRSSDRKVTGIGDLPKKSAMASKNDSQI